MRTAAAIQPRDPASPRPAATASIAVPMATAVGMSNLALLLELTVISFSAPGYL